MKGEERIGRDSDTKVLCVSVPCIDVKIFFFENLENV